MNIELLKETLAEGFKENCITHHHACDCREKRLFETLRQVCQSLRDDGMAGNQTAFQAYVDLNELWLDQYGHEILDERINKISGSQVIKHETQPGIWKCPA